MSFTFQGAYSSGVPYHGFEPPRMHLYVDLHSRMVRGVWTSPSLWNRPAEGTTREVRAPMTVLARVILDQYGKKITLDDVLSVLSDLRGFLLPGAEKWTTMAPGLLELHQTRKVLYADYRPLNTDPPIPVDLSGADLALATFTKSNFTGAILTRANFNRTVFRDCIFGGGSFRGAICSGADFALQKVEDLDLTDADFSNAKLSGARIKNCTANFTNFSLADLNAATFIGSRFSDCVFYGADLSRTKFNGTTLERGDTRGASFVAANFENATLNAVDFSDMILDEAKFGGETPAKLTAVNFKGARLYRTDFTGVTLEPTNASLIGARFGDSETRRTTFARARLNADAIGNDWSWFDCTDATFTGFGEERIKAVSAILNGVDFSDQSFSGDFQTCELRGASFANCDLEDATFTNGSVLRGSDDDGRTAANFAAARLRNVIFNDVNLSGVSFAGADLWGAKFEKCTVMQTSFVNAFAPQVDFRGIKDRQMAGANFTGAFLVSAKFQETALTAMDDRAPDFTRACLLGADFTSAKLFDAILTGAKLATQPGKIVALLTPRAGRPRAKHSFQYQATILPTAITGPKTHCPKKGHGPCTEDQLRSSVPTEWVQPD